MVWILGALITGTCLASAFASLLMGVLANYPIGLAPGMGANFFFIMTLVPACAVAIGAKKGAPEAWQMALGVVLVSGVIFAVMSAARIRHLLMDAIRSESEICHCRRYWFIYCPAWAQKRTCDRSSQWST